MRRERIRARDEEGLLEYVRLVLAYAGTRCRGSREESNSTVSLERR